MEVRVIEWAQFFKITRVEDFLKHPHLIELNQLLAPDDVRIVVLRDTIHGEDHAVAAARLDGRWLMLDNRRMAMIEDADVRNFQPTFVIGQHGVMRYADAPLLADAAGNNSAAPLVVSSLAASAKPAI